MTNTAFKHSGVEWLGEIPKHWEIVPLKRLFYISKKENLNQNPNILSLTFGGIIERDTSKSEGQWAKSYIGYNIVEKNDIVFNPMDLLAGYVAKSNFNGVISPAYTLIKPLKKLNMDYYERLFQNWYHQKVLYHLGKGISHENRWTLTNDTFLNLPVLLPPLNEQKQIAEFLDSKCAKIAEFIDKKQRIVALLKEQKAALINECVCGRLKSPLPCGGDLGVGKDLQSSAKNPSLRGSEADEAIHKKAIDCHEVVPTSRNDTHPLAPSAREGGQSTAFKFKHSGVEWLGEIPAHWEVRKLKQIAYFDKGLSITKENLKDNGIFVVSYGEIHSKYPFEVNPQIHKLKCVDENYLDTNFNSLLHKDDFVFADTSEDIIGSGNFSFLNSEIPTFAGYHTIICRIKNLDCHESAVADSRNDGMRDLSLRGSAKHNEAIHKINAKFLAYEFESSAFRSQIQKNVSGVKVYSITQNILKDCEVWIPPLVEQKQIAEFLDKKCESIDKAIALIEQEIESMKAYKVSLIDKAIKGRINV